MSLLDTAKKRPTTSKTKSAKKAGVPTFKVTSPEVKNAIDKVRNAITTGKKAKADLEQYGDIVVDFFLETKESEARSGNFRKSFRFDGHKETLLVKHSNRALKINYDDEPEIRKILSGGKFETLLEETTQMTVKPEVLEPKSALGAKLWKMLGKNDEDRDNNFALFFESKVSLQIKDDFDRNIFRLPVKIFNALKVYVKQIKPALQ